MSSIPKQTFSVIEFTSLPQNLRTAEMRKKFDMDGSGFLEAKNAKGQNEIYRLEQSMGLDLSKYKKEASKVEGTYVNVGSPYVRNCIDVPGSIMYDKSGKPSVVIGVYSDGSIERTEIKGNTSTTRTYDANFNIKPEGNGDSYKVTENATFNGIKGLTKVEWKNSDGSTTIEYEKDKEVASEYTVPTSPNYIEIRMTKDANGKITSFCQQTVDPKRKTEWGTPMIKCNGMSISQVFANDKFKLEKKHTDEYLLNDLRSFDRTMLKSKDEYFFNGKPAQVVPVENGRYEITQDGKTACYSHDGKKLRMDYVTAETKNLENLIDGYKNAYKKKVSVDGKTSWYYDPKGKQISQADYHSKVVKDIKIKNGKFTYYGKELPAKRNRDGSYNVTLGNEVFTLRMQVTKKKKVNNENDQTPWYLKIFN